MQGTDPKLAAGVCEGEILAGKYRIERVLGVGGMGAVVAARHLQLDTRVAIKFLLPGMLGDENAVSRFAREARAAVKITSEHVARVFDVGTLDNGAPYMVMEFLEGGDLAAWLQQGGPLPIEQAVDFVLQACVAVADAHSLGIVHRDLKPANLFCVRRSDGQFLIKVLDFGISKLIDGAASSARMSMTSTTAVMGSPLYMSPEQMQSPKGVDASTDIWALGIVLFELLTGKVPFTGTTFGEIAVKVATQLPPPMRAERPDVPPDLEAAIRKCLRPNRDDRYRNVAELAVAIIPFGPARARTSVDRISGILHASSPPDAAFDAAPAIRGTILAPGTIGPFGGTAPGAAPRRRAAVAVVVGALVVLGTALAILARSRGGGAEGAHPPEAALSLGAIPVLDVRKTPPALDVQTQDAAPAVRLTAQPPESPGVAPGAASGVTNRSAPARPRPLAGANQSGHPVLEPPPANAPVVSTPSPPADTDPLSRLKLKP